MCPETAYGRNFLMHILFSMQQDLSVQNICKRRLFSVPKTPKESIFSSEFLKRIQVQSFNISAVTDHGSLTPGNYKFKHSLLQKAQRIVPLTLTLANFVCLQLILHFNKVLNPLRQQWIDSDMLKLRTGTNTVISRCLFCLGVLLLSSESIPFS